MWSWLPKAWGGVKEVLGMFAGPAAEVGAAALGYKGQQETNAANAAQAQKQMDFQERMRATQYQTSVEDLQKAGLNPALAYQQGGAGTPGGAAATMGNPMAAGVSSAAQAASVAQQIANVRLTQATADKTASETELNRGELNARAARPIQGSLNEIPQNAPYFIASRIAEYQRKILDTKMTQAQFDDLVKLVAAQLQLTNANARESTMRGNIMIPEDWANKQDWGKWRMTIKDVLGWGSSASSILGKF